MSESGSITIFSVATILRTRVGVAEGPSNIAASASEIGSEKLGRFQTQEQRPRNASMGGAIIETFCHSGQKQVKLWGNATTALATWCMLNWR